MILWNETKSETCRPIKKKKTLKQGKICRTWSCALDIISGNSQSQPVNLHNSRSLWPSSFSTIRQRSHFYLKSKPLLKRSLSGIELWPHSGSNFHLHFRARALSVRIVLPGPQIITPSRHDRNKLSLCFARWGIGAAEVFFRVFNLERRCFCPSSSVATEANQSAD